MSQQTSPTTPKQSYVAAVARPVAVTNVPSSDISTRAMANKMTLNAAAASLHAAKVPTKPRTYTASSIMAAATSLIARTQREDTPAIKTPSSNAKVDTPVAKTPSPNMKAATPKAAETPRPDCTVSVLTVGASTMEEQMQEMRRMLEQVLKDNEERNKKLEELQKEVVSLGKKKVDDEVATTITPEDGDGDKITSTEIVKAGGVAYVENHLQVLIANAVKTQLTGNSTGGARYTKPYSKRINNLCMPQGYQPPKFQQFDGNGNPKQHVAHFVETCSNAGTEGELLVKQFVRSLKSIAFDWYTDLEPESIESWRQMEDEFFNRFYSTRRIVSMSELTNTKQWHEEPVVNYINRWRALCLECKDRVSETSAVEMCIDGMNWELLYILKGNKPKSFQELATRAHDMEITVRGHKHKNTSSSEAFREMEHEEIDEASQSLPEEAMAVSTNNTSHKKVTTKAFKHDKHSLKELLAKKYPFSDSDLSSMLDDLLEKDIIQLPDAKRPDEVNMTNCPKYCRYHRMIGQNTENCMTLKELIMKLVKEGRIVLDDDDIVETNHITITTCNNPLRKPHEGRGQTIQFGKLPPVKVWVQKPSNLSKSTIPYLHDAPQNNQEADDAEGWTVVARKRPKHLKEKKWLKQDVKSQMLPVDLLEQVPPGPITLGDFFPEGYLNKVTDNVASGAANSYNKKELDDKVSNTKCTNRPPIQWRKGRIKSRS